ncbi:MAG: hypothetical protein R3F41_02735 [Gammaproteobacteria bacterium]|nr:hypothetical protein [Pseudomonadales bacterium]MCP5345791.1 hypothetical protein [Pseudomonadales bacterium]
MNPGTKFTSARIGLLLACVALVLSPAASSQLSYRKGQHVEPAYEGWRKNEDGTFSFIFGYFNENWEEEIDIPVGGNNFFSPGDPDRGQPTHFLPRRNRFTFEVVVPADWGDQELVWETTSPNGVTRRAYGTLATDYVIDNVVIASETGSLGAGTSSPESRANVAPQLTVLGDSRRTVSVGQPLQIRAQVLDDGIPKPRRAGISTQEELTRAMLNPPSRITVGKHNGLFLSWNVYRGPDSAAGSVQESVQFDPPQVKPWEDTRTSANSPWGALWQPPAVPEDGIYSTEVTFDTPGTYVLWGRADDGGLYQDQYVTVTVTP